MTTPEPVTTLVVRVFNQRDGNAQYIYELSAWDGEVNRYVDQEYQIEINQGLIQDLSLDLDKILEESQEHDPEHRAKLAECGQSLYSALFPPVDGKAPALLTRLHATTGPLLVRTSETVVPWELLYDGTEFLGLVHDLSRRSAVRKPIAVGRGIGAIERALIVGDPLGDLPYARSEATEVARWLGDRGTECTVLLGEQASLARIVTLLGSDQKQKQYDLFHYAGHAVAEDNTTRCGLLLHRRRVLDEGALRGIARVGAPPVVFINGCGSAGPVANLCVSFMLVGAKTIVGTRTAVADKSSPRFAKEFYGRLSDDKSAGKALREAREALSGEPHAAWASFVLYGDPSVRISTAPLPPPKPKADLDDEALDLLGQASLLAAGRGVVTSMDLLMGLITTESLQERLKENVGAERLEVVTKVLHTFLDNAPRREPKGSDPKTVLSDTVVNVLVEAEDGALAEERTKVTPYDVALAFARVGGGTSTRLLELVGLSLKELILGLEEQPVPDSPEPPEPPAQPSPATDKPVFPVNDDDRMRDDQVAPVVARAIRVAVLLAKARGEVVGTYTLLQAFALTGSDVLRRSLGAQPGGTRALHRLSAVFTPRRAHFSSRTLAALKRGRGADPADNSGSGPALDEAAVLRGLLADENSSARDVLVELGVDADALIRDLRPPG